MAAIAGPAISRYSKANRIAHRANYARPRERTPRATIDLRQLEGCSRARRSRSETSCTINVNVDPGPPQVVQAHPRRPHRGPEQLVTPSFRLQATSGLAIKRRWSRSMARSRKGADGGDIPIKPGSSVFIRDVAQIERRLRHRNRLRNCQRQAYCLSHSHKAPTPAHSTS